MQLNEEILYQVYAVVGEIPYGKVATYGQIAKLIGKEKSARMIGKSLSLASFYGDYPCHRVVNFAGRLASSFPEQRRLLQEENVSFQKNDLVNLKESRWNV